jgi:glycosyltransferase involved in cell wall biosynthesis
VIPPRVALFADCLREVNGVARTCREFCAFARRRGYPLLPIASRPPDSEGLSSVGGVIELPTSAASFAVDADLRFDLLFLRHRRRLRAAFEEFRPDVVHITGPGHLGILGALLAHDLRVPLAASWHTNVHEYAGRRLERMLRLVPSRLRAAAGAWAERDALAATLRFYRLARLTFAPNPELVRLLRERTGRPSFLMPRGIDLSAFSPRFRQRDDRCFVVGYVGRLTTEKNLRVLADAERALRDAGVRDYRFLVVGGGSERDWLAANLVQAEFPGVLLGDPLARAYASLDAFVFPSETDTFGNVVQEAFASGVPAIVADRGGPTFLVQNGVNGFRCRDGAEFGAALLRLYADRALLDRLREGALASVRNRSWDAVFEGVYRHYALCCPVPDQGREASCPELALH